MRIIVHVWAREWGIVCVSYEGLLISHFAKCSGQIVVLFFTMPRGRLVNHEVGRLRVGRAHLQVREGVVVQVVRSV